MASPKKVPDRAALLRLWFHECQRVFADRLINHDDLAWFNALLALKLHDTLGVELRSVLPDDGK
eukprot:549009-Prorocentrum_lima.AAC.1